MAKGTRRSITFSSNALERMEKMQKMTDAENDSEVVRNALRLYEWVLDEMTKGNKIYLAGPDQENPMRMPILEVA